MPNPRYPKKNESDQEYLSRCIAAVSKEEGKTQKEAKGQCYGMLRYSKKKKS